MIIIVIVSFTFEWGTFVHRSVPILYVCIGKENRQIRTIVSRAHGYTMHNINLYYNKNDNIYRPFMYSAYYIAYRYATHMYILSTINHDLYRVMGI